MIPDEASEQGRRRRGRRRGRRSPARWSQSGDRWAAALLLPAAVVVELVVVDKLESMGLGASNLLAGITVEAADGLRPITVSEAQIICGP